MHDLLNDNQFTPKNISHFSSKRLLIHETQNFNHEFSSLNVTNKDMIDRMNIFGDNNYLKMDLREFNRSQHKFMIKDKNKTISLKKFMKKIKNKPKKGSKANKNKKFEINNKKRLRHNSLKKVKEINDYIYVANKRINTKKQIHKLIYETKKKFVNNFNEKYKTIKKLKKE